MEMLVIPWWHFVSEEMGFQYLWPFVNYSFVTLRSKAPPQYVCDSIVVLCSAKCHFYGHWAAYFVGTL